VSALGVCRRCGVLRERIGEMRDERRAMLLPSRRSRRSFLPGVAQLSDAALAPERRRPTAASLTWARRPARRGVAPARRPPPVAISVVQPSRDRERTPSPPFCAVPLEPVADAAVAPTRWGRMREEIALCAPDGFFAKLICELDVRTRYCSGWWGSADECPSGRTADYGN
jgi:hypothetical protein